jgi:small subunit ribosomal protein S20
LPHPASAKKRLRQAARRQERNRSRRTAARSAVRKARESIAAGNKDEAEAAVREAAAVLDRTARKGVVHPNNAARRKSRLMRQLNAIGTEAAAEAPKRRTRAASSTRSRAKKS